MGEGASGGGGGGSEDRRSTSAPSARPVQRPSARPDPVAPAPRGGGRGGDPRQFGFDPAAAAAARAPRPSALTPGVDVALLTPDVEAALRPPRLEAGYSTPSPQPNRMFDTTVAMARPAINAARENLEASRGGVGDFFLNMPLAALNLADAAARGGAGLIADLIPGDSAATEWSVARGIMALPEAFMGVTPGRVTNVLDEALDRVSDSARIRDLGQRIAADEFIGRYPGDELGTFEGAYVPDSWQISGLEALPDLSLASPGEQRYLKSLSAAEDMRALGATPQEIFARTGIVDVPRRDVTGAEIGPEFRLSTSTAPKFSAIDQNALDRVMAGEGLMLRDVMDLPENLQEGLLAAGVTRAPVSSERLGRNEAGYFSANTGDRIVLNTRYPEEARPTTRHEAAHLYLSESGVPTSAVGSSPAREAFSARRALINLQSEVKAAEDAYRMGDIDSDQLQEAYNAAAMQRTAYSRSPVELYSENLGEILARRAEGNTSQYVTAGLREAFNPYIQTTSGINEGRGLFANVRGAVTAPLQQVGFQASRAAGYPNPVAYGVLAQVPSNIFTRATTGERVPVFNVPFPTVTSDLDPWANVGNDRFDFDAFD
jgi:hypothetical protein